MVLLSWTAFGLLALLWTGGAWMTAEVMQWLAQALASGGAAQGAREVAALPLPAWAQVWIDPAWLEMLQSLLRWSADVAGTGAAAAGSLAGWVVAAIWVGWGLGMLLLVVGALAAHWLIRRFTRRPAVPA